MNIDHISFGIKDFKKSLVFYSRALSPLGLKVLNSSDDWAIIGKTKCDLWFGFVPGEVPKSMHVAFVAESHEQVREFYKAAMDAGATDNGKPGFCPEYGEDYYAAFVIDLNGHNIEAVCRKGSKKSDAAGLRDKIDNLS